MAAKAASLYGRRALGMTAGAGMAIGLAGTLGSVVIYATALPPWEADDERFLKNFHAATDGLYSGDRQAQDQAARVAAAATAGMALAGPMRAAAKRAA